MGQQRGSRRGVQRQEQPFARMIEHGTQYLAPVFPLSLIDPD